jgi:hypothetical protein
LKSGGMMEQAVDKPPEKSSYREVLCTRKTRK